MHNIYTFKDVFIMHFLKSNYFFNKTYCSSRGVECGIKKMDVLSKVEIAAIPELKVVLGCRIG